MFAYCGNNPVVRKDEDGEAFETVFDIISLVSSVVDVANNPSSAWAWAGLIGDVIDVAVPFVGGVGEAVRAVKAVDKAVDAADTLHDIDKAVDFSGGLCFVAGTLVLTSAGFVPIEDIAAGDLVWACNPETDEVNLKPVVQTFINETDELVHIHVNDEEIVCTPEHPFYSPVKGWTEAIQLRAGDILVTVNGEYVIVEQVQHEILENPIPVYNFEVKSFHTYFVSCLCALTHNHCSMDDVINSAEETTSSVGITRNFQKEGGFPQAKMDFDMLSPKNIKQISTQYGPGLVGTVDNTTVVLRNGSKTGGPTLEFQISSRLRIKIRYLNLGGR